MSKLSEWKMMCLAMAGVALSSLAANVVRADSLSDQAAKLDIVGVHIGMTPAQAEERPVSIPEGHAVAGEPTQSRYFGGSVRG